MERNPKIEQEIIDSLKEYSAVITCEKQSYKVTANNDIKNITITWPYPLMEVFFDFAENKEIIMSESIEFYENETEEDLRDYIVNITKRFFNLPVRIETLGKLLKRKELQVYQNSEWCSIYD
jgi:hypothetical protein